MKKIITLSCLMLLCSFAGMAQKFALIDMEYILKNIPAYEMTNEQLSQVSKKWQNEVEAIQQEAQNMYKNYQSDLVFLSAEMKTKREEEIVKKEQEAQDLKRKYFGPEGELYKKRESFEETDSRRRCICGERNLGRQGISNCLGSRLQL